VFRGKIMPSALLAPPTYPWVGLFALVHHTGIMSDGSHYNAGVVGGHPAPGEPEFSRYLGTYRERQRRVSMASDPVAPGAQLQNVEFGAGTCP